MTTELGDEVEVEVAGLRCFGVNQQAPASDLGAELRRPAVGVGAETSAEPAALVLARRPEKSHQRHRLWIAAGALANPGRNVLGALPDCHRPTSADVSADPGCSLECVIWLDIR